MDIRGLICDPTSNRKLPGFHLGTSAVRASALTILLYYTTDTDISKHLRYCTVGYIGVCVCVKLGEISNQSAGTKFKKEFMPT